MGDGGIKEESPYLKQDHFVIFENEILLSSNVYDVFLPEFHSFFGVGFANVK